MEHNSSTWSIHQDDDTFLLYQYMKMASSYSSFDSTSSRSSTSTNSSMSSYMSCKRNGRRNAIQFKNRGANFTVKNGQWTLWIDTLRKDEIESYKEAFSMFDKKGKGVIHSRHLGDIMRSLGQNPKEREVSDVMDELTDGKSSHCQITFPQFVTIMAQKRRTSEQCLRDTLEILDNNGFVNGKELAKDLSTIGDRLKPDEIEEFFADLEIDEDGNVSYDDLVEMISSNPEVYDSIHTSTDDKSKRKSSSKEFSVSSALQSFFGT